MTIVLSPVMLLVFLAGILVGLVIAREAHE
jgi:hypothetical protein